MQAKEKTSNLRKSLALQLALASNQIIARDPMPLAFCHSRTFLSGISAINVSPTSPNHISSEPMSYSNNSLYHTNVDSRLKPAGMTSSSEPNGPVNLPAPFPWIGAKTLVPIVPITQTRHAQSHFSRWFRTAAAIAIAILIPSFVFASMSLFNTNISGYIKNLNIFTKTSGFTPEVVDNPLAVTEKNEQLFETPNRLRLKLRSTYKISDSKRIIAKIDYDQQAKFGSLVGSGDFRISQNQTENRRFLDLSQTLVEKKDYFYEHRLYRASAAYESDFLNLEVGRQQIPWGVGYFFTPTDVFNPFNPTQVELDERDGVDAVNLIPRKYKGIKSQFIYTPRGRELHPQRYLARFSGDFKNYEIGVLGGGIHRDFVSGFDLAGNIRGSAIRGEFLYREAHFENDFIKFTLNADYNFPYNFYGLLEYHFNGQGNRSPGAYKLDHLIRGDIQQLGRNYIAVMAGHDITPLIRIENRAILNIDDFSLFIRPEIRYEIFPNFIITGATQLFAGNEKDEFGRPKNLYLTEAKYSF